MKGLLKATLLGFAGVLGVVVVVLTVAYVRYVITPEQGQFELTVENASPDSLLNGALVWIGNRDSVVHKLGALAPGEKRAFVFRDVAEPPSYDLHVEFSRRGKPVLTTGVGYPMMHDTTRVATVVRGDRLVVVGSSSVRARTAP